MIIIRRFSKLVFYNKYNAGMHNKFYSEFDTEHLHQSKRDKDYRSAFQIDRDRIIHSSEFRRLQGKTQVFLPGEYDFYRTRLTHSIEVAQIGRSICSFLQNKETDFFGDDYFVDPNLVESACLAHDLGHPPFGHAGERTLHRLMKDYGGFEGNAQTLRILTETIYRTEESRRGMNPCRAFLDATLKYKSLFGKLDNPANHYLYDTQKEYIDFVFEGYNLHEHFANGEEANSFRSIECQIMDWADDTAYAINDILDSVIGGFITIEKLVKYAKDNSLEKEEVTHLEELIELIKEGRIKPKLGSQIGEFIQSCSIEERKTFMDGRTNRYKYILKVDEGCAAKANFYKTLAVKMVFRSPQLHQMEFKGDYMLTRFFNTLKENYIDKVSNIKLLPDFNHNTIAVEKDEMRRARLVCDYLAGMTDSFAMRSYRRLFDPNYSALADLV